MLAVNNFGDTRSGGLAGPMGLFVIVLLCVATVLLIRNMNKRLRRLPDSFPDAEPTQREAEIASPDPTPEQPGVEPLRRNVDSDRSQPAAPGAEGEVTGVTTERDATPAEGDQGRV
jgi:hypothetical protein